MNNTTTKRTLALVAVFMAATLVVGATFAATLTTSTAFAYSQKKPGGQDSSSSHKKGSQQKEKGNSKNGNTVTIEECKNKGPASGFDTSVNQECENLICTHPGENATCSQEGAAAPIPIPTPTPITTTLRVIKVVDCLATDPDCSLPDLCNIQVLSPSTGPAQIFRCESAIGNGVLVTLNPGKFETVEVIGPGFDHTLAGDCSGTIAAGQHLTCTITNTEKTTAPTMQVSGQGIGENFCPRATVPHDGSLTFSAQEIGGTVQGQFNMLVNFTANAVGSKSGTLNSLQISGNSFIVTGTETASFCSFSQLPTTVTISGQCGTGVAIQYTTADGEHATFTGNVACTI